MASAYSAPDTEAPVSTDDSHIKPADSKKENVKIIIQFMVLNVAGME